MDLCIIQTKHRTFTPTKNNLKVATNTSYPSHFDVSAQLPSIGRGGRSIRGVQGSRGYGRGDLCLQEVEEDHENYRNQFKTYAQYKLHVLTTLINIKY